MTNKPTLVTNNGNPVSPALHILDELEKLKALSRSQGYPMLHYFLDMAHMETVQIIFSDSDILETMETDSNLEAC